MVDGNAGKGSKYRPVDQKKWNEGWKKAFGQKTKRRKSPGVMEPGGIIDMSDIQEQKGKRK